MNYVASNIIPNITLVTLHKWLRVSLVAFTTVIARPYRGLVVP